MPGLTPDTPLKVCARCRHVWTENRRVLTAVEALQAGDIATLARLLNVAHVSARDDYQISCAEVDTLVALLREMPGVLGARLTGAGWSGCVVALVEGTKVDEVCRSIQERYLAATGISAEAYICQPGCRAGLVQHHGMV